MYIKNITLPLLIIEVIYFILHTVIEEKGVIISQSYSLLFMSMLFIPNI